MPIVAIIVAVVFVAVAALLAYIATKPPEFRIERTAAISAPPAVVFPYINDLHAWTKWSPFEKLDPAMKKTFEGPAAGPGASYGWAGNNKAGAGTMTITDATPDQQVLMDLAFTRPFKATNKVIFTITPTAAGSQVTWCMTGNHNLMGKAFSTFCDMDKMVGSQFAEGLENLNQVTSNQPTAA